MITVLETQNKKEKSLYKMPNSILGHKHEIQGLAIKCYSKSLFKTVMQLKCMRKYALEFLGRVLPSIYIEKLFCRYANICLFVGQGKYIYGIDHL